MIYYSLNGTVQDSAHALATGWIGPSITPLRNVNSGFRMYEVDTHSFDVMEAYTFFADVNSFPKLNSSVAGPVFKFEYSTRDTYPVIGGWPASAPLNATYWHKVTEAMKANHTLISIHNTYQGKSSVKSPNCTSNACAEAKICYMRSGNVALGRSCPQGYVVPLCHPSCRYFDLMLSFGVHDLIKMTADIEIWLGSDRCRAHSLGRTSNRPHGP